MIVYGYVKGTRYSNDGTFQLQVRIPSIHGPYKQTANTRQRYVQDTDLPWITSILLPHMPSEGEVAALESVSSANSSEFIVIGLTGGSYYTGAVLR